MSPHAGRSNLRVLLEALRGPDPILQRYAATALGDIGNSEVIPDLLYARHGAGNLLQGAIDEAIGRIAKRQAGGAELKPRSPPRSGTEFVRVDGRWSLVVNGQVFPQTFGVVYQPVPDGRHINDYQNHLSSLYRSLLDVSEGGSGHARKLREMGIYLIRAYALPIESPEDVDQTKKIFRRIYHEYGIRVLAGHYVGLYSNADFKDRRFREITTKNVESLVNTYGREPWIIGWQLGNENNLHVEGGLLERRINLSLEGYYAFMDGVAQAVRATTAEREVRHFILLGNGDLSDREADLISRLAYFDGLGLNVYRNREGMEQVVHLAEKHLNIPLILSEFGQAGVGEEGEHEQSFFYRDMIPYIRRNSRESGSLNQIVLAFVSEATDEKWKAADFADPLQARLGVFGKKAELQIVSLLHEYDRADRHPTLPTFKSSELNRLGWSLLDRYEYEKALVYAEAVTRMYGPLAMLQQHQAGLSHTTGGNEIRWALDDVGASLLIRIRALWESGARSEATAVYDYLVEDYGDAEILGQDGEYRNVAYCARKLFPEMFPRRIFRNVMEIIGGALVLTGFIMGPALARLLQHARLRLKRFQGRAIEAASPGDPVLSPKGALILMALVLVQGFLAADLAGWWFHPVRYDHYIVNAPLFWLLTYVGGFGFVFHWLILHLICAMRRPHWISPKQGKSVALVTTYVESEPLELVQSTLLRMLCVTYPHDTVVLDESNSPTLALFCREKGIVHFSRRLLPKYQQMTPPFQSRTKGGNLNAWLDAFGGRYEFVTFFDCDHQPVESYLDRVLGYFNDPRVGCVQAPNVYSNQISWVAEGNIQPNAFFVGPVQMGLHAHGAPMVNGSHSSFRITALKDIGLYAVHLADDILTGLRLCAKKWKVVYVPEILAEGLAPTDWPGTFLQSHRWSQSMFDLFLFKYPRYIPRLQLSQIIGYVAIGLFYFLHVNFALLVAVPIIATIINQSPANVGVREFLSRFGPLYLLQLGTLTLWGQRYLLRPEKERGFWWKCGLVEIAESFYVIYGLARTVLRQQLDRRAFVASKDVNGSSGIPLRIIWRLFLPHIAVTSLSLGALVYSLINAESHWQTEGMRLFLVMNVVTFGGLVWAAIAKRA